MKCPNCNHEFEIENNQKKGMLEKAKSGKVVSRPAFGYHLENGKLVPNEKAKIVEQIFLEFKDNEISLNQLSQKYNFSEFFRLCKF
jgi:DNA invertase Pin-like site-specific DNA recombinase